jgi:hypothetical protein
MSVESYKIRLTGRTDLVLHNNQCVDPLNPLKKQISAITGKKKKTDADHLQLRVLEFIAGLYFNDQLGPYIPAQNLRKMLIEAARKDKNGKQFESGVFIEENSPIEYEGPRTVNELIAKGEEFMWTTPAGNQASTIMRTRPRFKKWAIEFVVLTESSLVNRDMIVNALRHAEISVGICDARSIGCGRFKAEIL